MEVERLQEEFIKTLGEGGEISCYFAPGRVNLSESIPIIMGDTCFLAR